MVLGVGFRSCMMLWWYLDGTTVGMASNGDSVCSDGGYHTYTLDDLSDTSTMILPMFYAIDKVYKCRIY